MHMAKPICDFSKFSGSSFSSLSQPSGLRTPRLRIASGFIIFLVRPRPQSEEGGLSTEQVLCIHTCIAARFVMVSCILRTADHLLAKSCNGLCDHKRNSVTCHWRILTHSKLPFSVADFYCSTVRTAAINEHGNHPEFSKIQTLPNDISPLSHP